MSVVAGLEQLNVYGSSLQVDFREVAAARGIAEKEFRNVRFDRRSVLPLFEDPVTLAVNAARPIVAPDIRRDIELCIVATETGLDYGKPLSTYVQEQLGLGPHCRNFEIKHACFGGTAALHTALSFVRTSPAKKALVVMTDIARCHFGDMAEITAGAGAVALLVSTTPRIATVSPVTGRASKEVYDVARPTPTSEHNDPVLSLYAYLDLVEQAWEHYRAGSGATRVDSAFDYMLYHAPLTSLVERAHRVLLDAGSDEVDSDVAAASFAKMVAPSLRYNRALGNIYSGSLYASLAGLIDNRELSLPAGTRVGCFSYGSGSCSELFALELLPQARETLAAVGIEQHLEVRRRLAVADYERLAADLEQAMTLADLVPDFTAQRNLYDEAYAGRHRLVLDRVEHHRRHYRWA